MCGTLLLKTILAIYKFWVRRKGEDFFIQLRLLVAGPHPLTHRQTLSQLTKFEERCDFRGQNKSGLQTTLVSYSFFLIFVICYYEENKYQLNTELRIFGIIFWWREFDFYESLKINPLLLRNCLKGYTWNSLLASWNFFSAMLETLFSTLETLENLLKLLLGHAWNSLLDSWNSWKSLETLETWSRPCLKLSSRLLKLLKILKLLLGHAWNSLLDSWNSWKSLESLETSSQPCLKLSSRLLKLLKILKLLLGHAWNSLLDSWNSWKSLESLETSSRPCLKLSSRLQDTSLDKFTARQGWTTNGLFRSYDRRPCELFWS